MLNMQRQKYITLMQDIEDLEDKIEILEKANPEDPELLKLREQLSQQRNELARVSDGCGTPHNH